ncbi:MarR family transcriptional regulator [Tistrella mobilis]|uniref:MarR family winged helix-turn-helix transcriptional regulator n=1 Tax=Tistrella mobilis TaxID=171437 RepID=UPI0031F63B22
MPRPSKTTTDMEETAPLVRDLKLFGLFDTVPIRQAYRLAFLTNFYRAPLLRRIEQEHGLTRPEWTILICLSHQDGLNPRDICDFTEQPRNNVSRGAALLEAKGLITRSPDPEDARRALLHLTETGRALYARLMPLFQAREAEMLAVLSPEERAQLDHLLTRLTAELPVWR